MTDFDKMIDAFNQAAFYQMEGDTLRETLWLAKYNYFKARMELMEVM